MRNRSSWWWKCGPLATLLAAPVASAVIVHGPGTTQNTTPPAGLTHWGNLGHFTAGAEPSGSGVYVGNGWVLTAGHAHGGNQTVQFSLPGPNGEYVAYGSQPGVFTQLLQPDGRGTDLTLFRLNDDARLAAIPSVRIGRTPQVGTGITVVGSGWVRRPEMHYWHLDNPGDPENTRWRDVTGLPSQGTAQASGYLYDTSANSYGKRWGVNSTEAFTGGVPTVDVTSAGAVTRMFVSLFDPNDNEAQVSNGDSGGGVFVNNRLVGINLAKGDYSFGGGSNPDGLGQPANTAVFGNASYFGDVFTYVDQIASVTRVHPGLEGDANLDGAVDFGDFRVLYDNLYTTAGWTRGDFNLDGRITFADYQILERNYGQSDGVAVPVLEPLPGIVGVPEPGVLGALAAVMALGLGRRGRRRQ